MENIISCLLLNDKYYLPVVVFVVAVAVVAVAAVVLAVFVLVSCSS